jgi:plastocyanin
MRRRCGTKLLAVAAVALSAAGASACGRTFAVSSDRTLSLSLTEYRVRPQRVRVSAGLLSIEVHNYGRLTHNLAISRDGQSEGSTQPLAPGQSANLALELTVPGTYTMASTLLSDQSLGAYGTLIVTR